MKEEWKTLGVKTVRGWCNKVKDRGWLASKLGGGKKKRKAKKAEMSRNTTCWDCCTIIHKTCLWAVMQHHFYAIKSWAYAS